MQYRQNTQLKCDSILQLKCASFSIFVLYIPLENILFLRMSKVIFALIFPPFTIYGHGQPLKDYIKGRITCNRAEPRPPLRHLEGLAMKIPQEGCSQHSPS